MTSTLFYLLGGEYSSSWWTVSLLEKYLQQPPWEPRSFHFRVWSAAGDGVRDWPGRRERGRPWGPSQKWRDVGSCLQLSSVTRKEGVQGTSWERGVYPGPGQLTLEKAGLCIRRNMGLLALWK